MTLMQHTQCLGGWEVSPLDASMSQRRWKKEDGWGFPERTGSERAVLMVESDGTFSSGEPWRRDARDWGRASHNRECCQAARKRMWSLQRVLRTRPWSKRKEHRPD